MDASSSFENNFEGELMQRLLIIFAAERIAAGSSPSIIPSAPVNRPPFYERLP